MPIIVNMDFNKYNYFYVNGSSHCEGGGLEESDLRGFGAHALYKKLYNVNWKNREEVNFGYRLSKLINVKCINESKSGAGVQRIVRMTYDFIEKNWKNKNKFFIILDKPDPSRCDVFLNKTNEYYIVNSKNDGDIYEMAGATRDYFNPKILEKDLEYKDIFLNWHENHFNFQANLKNDEYALAGLYSFCKFNNIKIFLMQKNWLYLTTTFDKEDIIKFSNTKESDDIYSYCLRNKLTITDELKGELTGYEDLHPGYFGHIEYAKELAKYLTNTHKNKLI
jgi:hypothetical protein